MKKIARFTPRMYARFCGEPKIQLQCCSDICEKLSDACVAYFAIGWENDIHCKFAHRTAKTFGIPIEYELKENLNDFQCTLDEIIKSSPGGNTNG